MERPHRRPRLLPAALAGVLSACAWLGAGAAEAATLPSAGRPGPPATAAAVKPPDTEHVLVGFKARTPGSARAALHRHNGAVKERGLAPEGVDVVRIARGDTVASALRRYRHDPSVRFAEPDARVSVDATPNDPFFSANAGGAGDDLWGLDNLGENGGTPHADIDAPEGWDTLGLSGSPWPTANFAVGVVDTGVDAGHPDLAGKVIGPCYTATSGDGSMTSGCGDDEGHGTHVAGTIAALGNNGKGVVGVAPNARIYPCKALDATGSGYLDDIVACMNEIVAKRDAYGIRVISMSLGGDAWAAEQAAVDHAWDSGVLVVAAAGNDSNTSVEYPAGYAHAVSVGATDRNDGHAYFSNANADVEVSAPGVDVLSTVPGGYGVETGTSMATPHAAAVAALIAWRDGKTGQALRDALDAAVDDLGAPGRDPEFGFGRVNLCRALGGQCTYGAGAPATGIATPPPSPVSPPPVPPPATTPPPPVSVRPLQPPTLRRYRPTAYRRLAGSVYDGRGSLGRLYANDGSRLELAGARRGRGYVSDLYAETRIVASERVTLRGLGIAEEDSASSRTASIALSVYDWSTRRWVTIDGPRGATTSNRRFRWSAGAWSRRYVSSTGRIRLRVRATRSGAFRTRIDFVRFTIAF